MYMYLFMSVRDVFMYQTFYILECVYLSYE
jgi:hypothetical protein